MIQMGYYLEEQHFYKFICDMDLSSRFIDRKFVH
jgi:hypothetical protein